MSQDYESKIPSNPEAQHAYATRLYFGTSQPRDVPKAIDWFSKACDQGYIPSETFLGCCYLNGVGVTRDSALAVKYFREAMDAGDAHAQYCLGWCYAFGVGVEKDTSKALEHLDAVYLRNVYAPGLLVQRILAENIETTKFPDYLTKARALDHFSSLEYCLRYGDYRPFRSRHNPYMLAASGRESMISEQKLEDYRLDDYLYHAEVGCLESRFKLAIHYIYSVSPPDLKRGLGFLHRAADASYPDAACLLGYYYEHGLKGLEINQDQALAYLRIAAEHQRPYAKFRLAMLQGGTPEEQFKVLTEAAACGVVDAAYELGRCYENGIATEVDANQAAKWYTEAASAGNGQAQYQLAQCYRRGFGVPANETRYTEWMEKAVRAGNHDAILAQSDNDSIF